MSTATQPAPDVELSPPALLRRFTVDEYHRMIQADVFAYDERFELLEGWIVAKMTRNPPHEVTIELLGEILRPLLPDGWRLRVQCAITTADSEPEPDLVIVRGAARDYLDHHPGPSEIALVIEVSDSSLSKDRVHKGRLYARAGIPVYWIVNLDAQQIEVYSDPTGPDASPRYRQRSDHGLDATIPLVVEGRQCALVAVRDGLP